VVVKDYLPMLSLYGKDINWIKYLKVIIQDVTLKMYDFAKEVFGATPIQ